MRTCRSLITSVTLWACLVVPLDADAENTHFLTVGPSIGLATGGDLETSALLSLDLTY